MELILANEPSDLAGDLTTEDYSSILEQHERLRLIVKSSYRWRFEIGRILRQVKEILDTYGDGVIHKYAESIGIGYRNCYQLIAVYETFKDVEHLIDRFTLQAQVDFASSASARLYLPEAIRCAEEGITITPLWLRESMNLLESVPHEPEDNDFLEDAEEEEEAEEEEDEDFDPGPVSPMYDVDLEQDDDLTPAQFVSEREHLCNLLITDSQRTKKSFFDWTKRRKVLRGNWWLKMESALDLLAAVAEDIRKLEPME